MSVATVAGGKVLAARERGQPIPLGWLLDDRGQPTGVAEGYPQHATLTPAAGHKGYGLALLIESLSAALTGAAMTWGVRSWLDDDPALPTGHGAAFLALDSQALAPELPSRVADLIDEVHASPCADGANRIYVPGEMEWARQEAARQHGVALPPDVLASLREGTALVGLDLDDYLLAATAAQDTTEK